VSLASSVAAGVLFGLAMAAPPGPMNAVIAEESVLRGWFAGARAGLGAMTGDAIFCVLALVGVVEIVGAAPWLRGVMVLAGGLLMGYFAVDAARGALQASEVDAAPDRPRATAGKGFRKALALSLTNPYQIVFWLTVGVGLLAPGELDLLAEAPWLAGVSEPLGFGSEIVIQTGSVALLGGFFGGIGLWITSYPAAVVALGERSDRAAPAVAGVSAAVLAIFGLVFVVDGLTTLA